MLNVIRLNHLLTLCAMKCDLFGYLCFHARPWVIIASTTYCSQMNYNINPTTSLLSEFHEYFNDEAIGNVNYSVPLALLYFFFNDNNLIILKNYLHLLFFFRCFVIVVQCYSEGCVSNVASVLKSMIRFLTTRSRIH